MAQWHIVNPQGVTQNDTFDDGLKARPGEEAFTNSVVVEHCATLGEGYSFNYCGTPNWEPPAEEVIEEGDGE